jgi:zinc transporter 5/7
MEVDTNDNVEGIFLHILADALGSVGVIISSVLVKYYNITIADPICSAIISVLIFVSVFPLIRKSTETLLLKSPPLVVKKYSKI